MSEAVKFQPGDVVRLRNGKDKFKVEMVKPPPYVLVLHEESGCGFHIHIDGLELVRRPGPVVFECRWFSDGAGLPIYPMGIGEDFPVMQQFLKKRTRVTVEVIEEGK
jgi:uncharacterized protein YodC (DUF2158 family)